MPRRCSTCRTRTGSPSCRRSWAISSPRMNELGRAAGYCSYLHLATCRANSVACRVSPMSSRRPRPAMRGSPMSEAHGHIELERRVDSIKVGLRHRSDPERDLAPLMRSIERLGLLQPVTITPDGVLVCGHRRLAAVKELGWTTLRVWVCTGVSDQFTQLLAHQDENTLPRPLSPLDAAALYRELKALLAEDAARRQRATRFGADDGEEGDGGLDSGPPQVGAGKAARQAAQTITKDRKSTRLNSSH